MNEDPLDLPATETNVERLAEVPDEFDETAGSIDELGMILIDDVPVTRFFGQAMRVDQAFKFMQGDRPTPTRDLRKSLRHVTLDRYLSRP